MGMCVKPHSLETAEQPQQRKNKLQEAGPATPAQVQDATLLLWDPMQHPDLVSKAPTLSCPGGDPVLSPALSKEPTVATCPHLSAREAGQQACRGSPTQETDL